MRGQVEVSAWRKMEEVLYRGEEEVKERGSQAGELGPNPTSSRLSR